MNYELVKQLKDAGFPQKGYTDKEQPKGWIAPDNNYGDWKVNDDYIYVPTLSELIEACGDKFDNLTRDYESSWKCNYYSSDDGYDDEQIYSSVGKTPEEAVAKLWLKLHK